MNTHDKIQLCGSHNCVCCGACVNICPQNAIRLIPDAKGFPIPDIDCQKCITCRRCENVCPVLRGRKSKNLLQPRTFAVWHENLAVRMASSSGGAFTLLAENVLGRGGLVVGAAWNREMIPELIAVERVSDLARLRESKYVQSNVGFVFREVRSALQQGREVLFCASPCQVAGLYAFLGDRRYTGLTTVDFICHAMPSQTVFKKYLAHLEKKFGEPIVGFHFRNKSIGPECNLLAVVELEGGREKKLFLTDNSFSCAFIHNLISKPACSTCGFNRLPRQADFSLADYRGLGEHVRFAYESDKVKGFTGVLVNTKHAEDFLERLNSRTLVERPLDELRGSQAHLSNPASDSELSCSFWKDFPHMEWDELSSKYIRLSYKYRLYIMLRRVLRPALFLRAGIIWKSLKGLRTTGFWASGKF